MGGRLPRILVAGVGPLPPESPLRLFAPGLRVWGIARQLALAGHEVRLVTLRAFGEDRRLHVFQPECAGTEVVLPGPGVLAGNPLDLEAAVSKEISAFKPAALVGTSDIMNLVLSRAAGSLPLWCDYDGDPMAERQMLAHLFDSDDGLVDQWEALTPALARGDRFSGTTRHQVGAILGQLAVAGRLNGRTATTPFVERVPIWVKPVPKGDETGPFVRGVSAPDDSFLIVQTGGFNSWLDVKCLFASVESAMLRDPRIHFVCTGGAIPGHNEKTWAEFERMVEASDLRGRFHRLGWVPLGRVPVILEECDVAINVDLPCAEGWLGNRNRIMDWLLAGLPVVSTLGSEVAEDLAHRGYIHGVAQSDPHGVADAILNVAANVPVEQARAREGAAYLRDAYSPEVCLRPLLDWAGTPERAADLMAWDRGESRPPALHAVLRSRVGALAELQKLETESAHAEARLRAMKGSRLVHAALRIRAMLGSGGD